MTPTDRHPALAEIQRLFDSRGHLVYGEAVDQTAHALQCGSLALQAQAPDSLVLAAWLHDIGHMQHRDASAAVALGEDDRHEALGARLLARWFGPAVAEPVRLHVAAKRYLCNAEAGYWEQLSPLSRRTLEIQGGPMDEAEARAFEQTPFAGDALQLRRWDDLGKQPGLATHGLPAFMAIAQRWLDARARDTAADTPGVHP